MSNITTIEDEQVLAAVNSVVVSRVLTASVVLVSCLTLVGAPGNALVFIVYFFRWRRTTSRIFIIALAVCDMFNCFVSMPIEIFLLVNFLQTDMPVLCKVSRFMTFLMNDASALILVGIAFDRFFRICQPFRKQMGSKRAKFVCFCSFLLSLLTGWPSAFLYGTTTIYIPVRSEIYVKAKVCLIDDNFTDSKYPLYFSAVILFCNIIIDVIVSVLYVAIAYNVIHSAKLFLNGRGSERSYSSGEGSLSRAGSSTSRRRLERSLSVSNESTRRSRMIKTTIMLFFVTLLFMLSFVPYCIIVLKRYLNPTYYASLSDTGKAFYQFFLRSYFLSSALNPVIYSFLSEQFRTECKHVLSKFVIWRKN